METESLWRKISKKSVNYPSLAESIEVDVAIIGGGITGITCALKLIESGKTVAILEANAVGCGTTADSTGNLYVAVQPYYHNLLKTFDQETVANIALSRKLAIDNIEQMVEQYHIDCNFARRPWFLYAKDTDEAETVEREYQALKGAGQIVDFVKELPYDIPHKRAIVMENQARFNPLQYVIELAEVVNKKGGLIFEHTRVTEYREASKCYVTTDKGKVLAKHMVIATHTPIGITKYNFLTAPYRSYAVAAEINNKDYPEGHFWDLSKPHHVFCTHSSGTKKPNLIIATGSHHKTGQGRDMESHFHELERFLKRAFDVSEFIHYWSAQHYQAVDGAPYIGKLNHKTKHTYTATGYFADGLVYGTVAGIVIANMINHEGNALSATFNSQRFKPLASAPLCLKESLNVMGRYLSDLPFNAADNYDDLKPCQGKVVQIKGQKYGVYKDAQHGIKIVSAVCTHMKCIVNWNNAEQTWDCPCHGSRFSVEGEILEGPAMSDLSQHDPNTLY